MRGLTRRTRRGGVSGQRQTQRTAGDWPAIEGPDGARSLICCREARERGAAPAHDAVLALVAWLPEEAEADAVLIAHLLGVPETEAAKLLDELEAAGCIASATAPVQ